MNKKFNLLALAAAASACGALVLTSCGGGGKTHIVLFKTDGLRDCSKEKLPLVSFKAQTVKDGNKMKLPIDVKIAEAKEYARFTWKDEGGTGTLDWFKQYLKGWSESTEDETEGEIANREFDYATPITYDTVLYPLYSVKKVHCLTLNLRYDDKKESTWVEDTCNANHVWGENWFQTGTNLKDFENKIKGCVKPLKNGDEVQEWDVWNSEEGAYEPFDWNQTIKEDITLVAVYGSSRK